MVAAGSAAVESEIEAAWYVLTILLRMGRPARMDEIVAGCRLFPASREFLQFLCRMPNSPLFLSDEGYVTVSSRVSVTFREFIVGGAPQFVPRVAVRLEYPMKVRDFGDIYSHYSNRKRRNVIRLPDPKRRALMRLENGESQGERTKTYLVSMGNFIPSTFSLKAHHAVQVDMILAQRASITVQEATQWIQNMSQDNEKGCELLDSEPRFLSPTPWTHKKQKREMISICDDSKAELVVDDSEDARDQSPKDPIHIHTSPEEKKINKDIPAEPLDSKLIMKKLKKTRQTKTLKKETREETSAVLKKQAETPKKLPHFEAFTAEEEEGSGGYGTVYRARRNSDGKTFAVKCPHPKAHPHHIHNELKMLERFGGRCFIIKYEGFFKSGGAECFVLEHVEHDRPEVLKKEIDIPELQWYGYCMFRALASLHKQGVVHRDVKPGNFLFSRKLLKGYLIDFNLALDLNQKHQANSKSQPSHQWRSASPSSSSSSLKTKRPSAGAVPESTKRPGNRVSGGKLPHPLSRDAPSEMDCRSKHGVHAGEGSGVTSTRTPSGDSRLREPIPCRGRKELINLAQEVMQTPSKVSSAVPVQRKRIAAPLGKAERHLGFLSPMPLLSNGVSVSPEKRQKTEGPCVGTKGFRAPEVLLKSIHQSCKVDVWSAGVTLLYLMIGRMPFAGDPEQNMKEIAKLRGSEDLWEVAKLHNRESAFPPELLEVPWRRRTGLEEWGERNTKRGVELVERIPKEMWDLVDRCLAVNPRLRISAEEALAHDFFAPCRESLRRQRLLRHASSPVPPPAAPPSLVKVLPCGTVLVGLLSGSGPMSRMDEGVVLTVRCDDVAESTDRVGSSTSEAVSRKLQLAFPDVLRWYINSLIVSFRLQFWNAGDGFLLPVADVRGSKLEL